MSSTLMPAKGNVKDSAAIVAKERQPLPLEPLHNERREIFCKKVDLNLSMFTDIQKMHSLITILRRKLGYMHFIYKNFPATDSDMPDCTRASRKRFTTLDAL